MAINTPGMQRLFQTAGSGQSQQGTGYTNLNKLFAANKENQLGQKVAGNLSSQIGGVQSQLAEQNKQFQEESEKGKVGGAADVEKREAVLGRFTSPSGSTEGPTDEETSAFERYRGGQYAGPQGLKDTSALKTTAQQLQGQVSSFSPSGTQELLRRTVGGDRYTQGQSRLDTLLMDRSKLTPIQRQAQGLGQEINRADLAASGQAELNKNLAQQFAKETQEKLTGGMGGIETAVKGQLTAAEAAEKDRLAKIQAVQQFAANKVPKLDESGKPVLDQYGNPVYDTTAKARGSEDKYEQADYLKNLLSGQGAQTEELKQIFGTEGMAKTKGLADIAGSQASAAFQPYIEQVSRLGHPKSDAQRYQNLANSIGMPTGGTYGTLTKTDITNFINQKQSAAKQNAFNNALIQNTSLAGQSLVGGNQEALYSNLAKTLANSQAAQGLTESGVASAQQRAQYEALNKLLGKTSAESKYRTEDPTKYEAGKYLLNPDQIKRTF